MCFLCGRNGLSAKSVLVQISYSWNNMINSSFRSTISGFSPLHIRLSLLIEVSVLLWPEIISPGEVSRPLLGLLHCRRVKCTNSGIWTRRGLSFHRAMSLSSQRHKKRGGYRPLNMCTLILSRGVNGSHTGMLQ